MGRWPSARPTGGRAGRARCSGGSELPAGLLLAATLAQFPEISTAVIDRRDGPLAVGQADGVACRTVEMFEAFGLADQLVSEAYWVNEVAFWSPDPAETSRIVRTGR